MNGEQYVARLKSDFVFFTQQIWMHPSLRLDLVAPIGDIETDILQWAFYGPRRNGTLAPRGIGKTHLITAAITCMDLFLDPNWKIQIVSKTEGEAKKTVHLIRKWIEQIDFLKHLQPNKDQRDAATQFDVGPAKADRTPSVVAKGIGGQLESTRAHRIIADDVETKNNTKTLESRTELDTLVREFAAIASYGQRRINYVGTPHHEESLYLKLMDRGYTFRTWPLLYPTTDEKVLHLAPILQHRLDNDEVKPGDIVAPYRFDNAYVLEQRAEGPTYFAMQQMLIADLGDALRYPLKLTDLIVFPSIDTLKAPIAISWGMNNGQGTSTRINDIKSLGFGNDALYAPIMFDDQWEAYNGTKMWIDPSGHGADKTAYAIVSHAGGHLWAHDVGSFTSGSSPETLDQLASLARKYHANQILVEDFALQSMFGQLLEPVIYRNFLEPGQHDDYPDGWKASVEMVRPPSVQKELRILGAMEPVMASHRLVISPTVAANEELQYQLTRLTRQRNCLAHEDELEALAMCCQQWHDMLNIDPDKSADNEREKAIERQLEQHYALAGTATPAKRWFQHH